METFRSVPIDIIQADERSAVDLFINQGGRLELSIKKGEVVSRERIMSLGCRKTRKIYYRASESPAFEEYLQALLKRVLSEPAVSPQMKASTFYAASVDSFRKVFDDPNPERIEEIKQTLKPFFDHIIENRILLHDLLSITEHDFTTYAHSVNVGIFATCLAVNFYRGDSDVGTDELERQCYGFFLHDIGKSKVPVDILGKKEHLSEDEWFLMKKHPEWGYAILMETGHLTDEAAYISMQHHERPDGTGYPFGMRDIHPCARICAIADIFDALTSPRQYKPAMTAFDAMEVLKGETRTEFDSCLLKTFITMMGPQDPSARVVQ